MIAKTLHALALMLGSVLLTALACWMMPLSPGPTLAWLLASAFIVQAITAAGEE